MKKKNHLWCIVKVTCEGLLMFPKDTLLPAMLTKKGPKTTCECFTWDKTMSSTLKNSEYQIIKALA